MTTHHCANCGAPVSATWARCWRVDGAVICCISCSSNTFRNNPDMRVVRQVIDAAAQGETPEIDLDNAVDISAGTAFGGGKR